MRQISFDACVFSEQSFCWCFQSFCVCLLKTDILRVYSQNSYSACVFSKQSFCVCLLKTVILQSLFQFMDKRFTNIASCVLKWGFVLKGFVLARFARKIAHSCWQHFFALPIRCLCLAHFAMSGHSEATSVVVVDEVPCWSTKTAKKQDEEPTKKSDSEGTQKEPKTAKKQDEEPTKKSDSEGTQKERHTIVCAIPVGMTHTHQDCDSEIAPLD